MRKKNEIKLKSQGFHPPSGANKYKNNSLCGDIGFCGVQFLFNHILTTGGDGMMYLRFCCHRKRHNYCIKPLICGNKIVEFIFSFFYLLILITIFFGKLMILFCFLKEIYKSGIVRIGI